MYANLASAVEMLESGQLRMLLCQWWVQVHVKVLCKMFIHWISYQRAYESIQITDHHRRKHLSSSTGPLVLSLFASTLVKNDRWRSILNYRSSESCPRCLELEMHPIQWVGSDIWSMWLGELHPCPFKKQTSDRLMVLWCHYPTNVEFAPLLQD